MKNNTLLLMVLFLAFIPFQVKTQVIDTASNTQSFKDYRKQLFHDYEGFRSEAKKNFEQFLAEAWTEYQSIANQMSIFTNPKPESLPMPKTYSGIIQADAPAVTFDTRNIPRHSTAEKSVALPGKDVETIKFYGCTLRFHFPETLKIKAKSMKESEVSKYYADMQRKPETKMLRQELETTVQRMGLNEWGYFLLLRSLSEKAFTEMNDRVLFCFYMLHSQGFKARVGRGKESGQLMLLLAIDNSKEVYTIPFFRFNGVKYYTVFGGKDGEDAYSYNEKADDSKLREIGLDFRKTLDMADCNKKRVLELKKADMSIEVPYSTSHLRYYDDLPLTVFPIYFKTGMAPEAQQALAETFGTLGKKYNKVQMTDIILNFVQTSFAYKIDEEQFGREKYFFPEEVIGYPYSDCEDRCALFAWLVRTFAGCEVIGVLYPDHLATGVCFGKDVKLKGKGFDFQGKHYIICDPTYANADIGCVMPKYEGTKYEIIDIP